MKDDTRKKSQTPTEVPKLGRDAVLRGLAGGSIAWLLPGAGHLYQGARIRAAVFFVLVLSTVGLGFACDGNLAAIDLERAPVLSRLQVASNLALGPMEPLLRKMIYGHLVYREPNDGVRPTVSQERFLAAKEERSFRRFSAYGSAYLLAAGLMNLLLVLDAWDIGIGRRS